MNVVVPTEYHASAVSLAFTSKYATHTVSTSDAPAGGSPVGSAMVAAKGAVELGLIDITARESPAGKGVTDKLYKIKPSDRSFLRSRLANFFFSLEADSRRVRVTSLKVETFSKTKPEEIPEDRWTFEADVISRSKDD